MEARIRLLPSCGGELPASIRPTSEIQERQSRRRGSSAARSPSPSSLGSSDGLAWSSAAARFLTPTRGGRAGRPARVAAGLSPRRGRLLGDVDDGPFPRAPSLLSVHLPPASSLPPIWPSPSGFARGPQIRCSGRARWGQPGRSARPGQALDLGDTPRVRHVPHALASPGAGGGGRQMHTGACRGVPLPVPSATSLSRLCTSAGLSYPTLH
jgi:hypothetical protein